MGTGTPDDASSKASVRSTTSYQTNPVTPLAAPKPDTRLSVSTIASNNTNSTGPNLGRFSEAFGRPGTIPPPPSMAGTAGTGSDDAASVISGSVKSTGEVAPTTIGIISTAKTVDIPATDPSDRRTAAHAAALQALTGARSTEQQTDNKVNIDEYYASFDADDLATLSISGSSVKDRRGGEGK